MPHVTQHDLADITDIEAARIKLKSLKKNKNQLDQAFFLCRISIKTPTKVKATIAITKPCIATEGIVSAKVENGLFVIIIIV